MPHLIEDAKLAAETDLAVLIVCPSDTSDDELVKGVNQWWVPRSVIESMDMDEVGAVGEIEVRTWFAQKVPGT